MGDSITEGTLNAWKKDVGSYVDRDEVVAIIDTDKVSVDVHSPDSGKIVSKKAKPGDVVLVGHDLFELQSGDSPPPASDTHMSTEETEPIEKKDKTISKKPLQEVSDSASFTTSKERSFPTATPTSQSSTTSEKPPSTLNVDPMVERIRKENVVAMSRLRMRVAERLKLSQNVAASLTTFNECDMGHLMSMRSALNKEFVNKHGIKFGFVSAFLYAAAKSLQQMPQLNAYISESGGEIVYKNYVDISVAVATKTGLLVPVIRDCDRKTIAELEKELASLAQRARDGKIALEEMVGGTFTISNGGVFGSLMGTPILNPPQSSILGLHSIKDRPIVKDGAIIVRPMMYLALTYDHRLIDGREAVLFLNSIKDKIEDPRKLLLDI